MTPVVLLRHAFLLALVPTLLGGLVAVAAPGATALRATAPRATAPAGSAPAGSRLASLADGAGVAAMLDLETKMSDSLWSGHAVPVVFDSAEQLPGHVVAAPYWGDTQLWTGVYLGGESLRYATAAHYLSTAGPGHAAPFPAGEDQAFWTAQRDQALTRVRTMLAAEHRDINIAEDWTSEPRTPPAVNSQDPTGPHTADFGGVVQGERGMVTRGCTLVGAGPLGIYPPNVDATNPINNHSNHVYEITWKHGDGGRYYCETSPSRDTYAGLTFGLLTAFDLVGPGEPALRTQIRDDLFAMADFLVKYGWNYPRPNGYVGTHSDEDGFVSPLMAHVPMARLNIANAARHVAEVAGTAADQQKWSAVWSEEFASQGPILGASMEFDAAQPNDGYFKYNLHHLTAFNLLRTLTGAERAVVAQGFSVLDKTTGDDLNAHFEAITYAVTGDQPRLTGAASHLLQWLDYRANTSAGQHVRNSPRCAADLRCVPQDQDDLAVDQAPGGAVTWYPGAPEAPPLSRASGPRAATPLSVAVRPPTDFLWQAPPTALDGERSATFREPGIDYLTPYWMLRYFTEVSPPSPMPFPGWAGPAHR